MRSSRAAEKAGPVRLVPVTTREDGSTASSGLCRKVILCLMLAIRAAAVWTAAQGVCYLLRMPLPPSFRQVSAMVRMEQRWSLLDTR